MNDFIKDELNEALRAVSSLLGKCEKALEKLTECTSQHTLLRRRIKALIISATLISATLED